MRPISIIIALAGAFTMDAAELIARWTFDSRENAVVREETGKNNGIIQGNIDALRIEKAFGGGAFYFDEGKAYVEVAQSGDISIVNDVTFTTTIKPASVAGYCTMFWKGSRKVTPEAVSYYLNLRDGKVEFKVKKKDGNWISWVTADACVAADRWAVITVTFKDGVVQIAVNGDVKRLNIPPDTAADTAFTELVANEHPLYFGSAQGSGGYPAYHFRGLIDEIAFYRGADIQTGASRIPVIACHALADSFADADRNARELAVSIKALTAEMERSGVKARGAADSAGIDASFAAIADAHRMISETISALSPLMERFGATAAVSKAPVHTAAISDLLQGTVLLGTRAAQLRSAVLELSKKMHDAAGPDTELLQGRTSSSTEVFARAFTETSAFTARAKGAVRAVRLFSANEPFAVAAVPSAVSLLEHASMFSTLDDLADTASVSLARGEREGVQLMVFPDPRSSAAVPIRMDVIGVPAGMTVTVSPMKSVNNSRSVVPVDHRGAIFDVILEGETESVIPAGLPRALFVRVGADEKVKAGTYRMAISLKSGTFVKQFPLTATVYDFTLPKKSSLKVAFSFFEQNYANWFKYGTLTDEQRLGIYRFINSYRVAPNNIYANTVFPDPKYLSELPDQNFSTLGYYGPHKKLTDDEISAFAKETAARLKALSNAGFCMSDAYLYCFDEYAVFVRKHFDADSVRRFSAHMLKEFPGIKLLQTSIPDDSIIDLFNAWVSPIESFELIKPEYRKRDSYEFWWYWVSAPRPFPNFFLGYPNIENRMAMLIGFKYDLPGCLYWCINREWPDNAGKNEQWPNAEWDAKYVNVFTKTDNVQCGQGNLIYPGKNGSIYPSIRFENLRDGIEDYDYLALLRSLAGEIRSGKRAKHASRLAEIDALLAMPDDVVESLSRWTKDAAVLGAFRKKVAAMIETVTK